MRSWTAGTRTYRIVGPESSKPDRQFSLSEGDDGGEEGDDDEGDDPELIAGHPVHEGFHSVG